MTKRDLCINDFISKLRDISNQLESFGYALIEEDKVFHFIEILNRDFEFVILIITHKIQTKTITINEVHHFYSAMRAS